MQIVEQFDRDTARSKVRDPIRLDVVYTGRSTRQALKKAVDLAAGLEARIRVILPRVVPFPLPLHDPPVSRGFDRRRVLSMVNRYAPGACVLICYCRDEVTGLLHALGQGLEVASRHTIVMAGKKRRWFPTKEQRTAERLEAAGLNVVFVDHGGNHA